jgi:halocin C8-like bacteriocin domain-containing protein
VKYIGKEGDKHRILIKEGVSGCGTKTKRIENKEVLILDKLYQPYPLQQKSEEGKDPNPIECEICQVLVPILCYLLATKVASAIACDEVCEVDVCLILIEDPIIYIICSGSCDMICNDVLQTILRIGIKEACTIGGDYVCEKGGFCC